jgi:hypothetical protein
VRWASLSSQHSFDGVDARIVSKTSQDVEDCKLWIGANSTERVDEAGCPELTREQKARIQEQKIQTLIEFQRDVANYCRSKSHEVVVLIDAPQYLLLPTGYAWHHVASVQLARSVSVKIFRVSGAFEQVSPLPAVTRHDGFQKVAP